ncbi:tetratricopeptide repeat protein [Stenotrophomonas aracearum]|uniref:Tetratricopeptide repeat protein n=1 Tax=Stenotrophomonas aracearum TaxID=3003272 RepID=A0ABY9YCK1_9GAMM|nr:tetratricopeptide repeat protein [Stenotrophomonas sp. A5588]WNH48604.1 tetratricopeptide repeat protein [Stenotrophomonas sp. A5588]
MADELVLDGQPGDAYAVLADHPASKSPGFRHRLAQLSLSVGDYSAALHCLETLRSQYDSDVAVDHDYAFALMCLGRLDDAAVAAAAAQEKHGRNPSLQLLQGRLAMLAGDLTHAVAMLGALGAEHPADAQVQGVLALALFDNDELGRAQLHANAAVALQAHQHEALLVLGSLALRSEPAVALGYFQRAADTHPGSGRALSGLGQSQMLQGGMPDAERTLQQAARAMPEHLGTWHALAWSQLLQGNVVAAQASFEQSLAVDRNFGDTHGGLALVHALQGRRHEAEEALKRAFRLDPRSMTAQYAQVVLRSGRGEALLAQQGLASLLSSAGVEAGMPIPAFSDALMRILTGRAKPSR